jgi:hypothetical protein
MLRIPHCLDTLLIDAGKVVSLTHPQHFTPHKHYFNVILDKKLAYKIHYAFTQSKLLTEASVPYLKHILYLWH